MKNFMTLLLCVLIPFLAKGQIPQSFNYQAVIRNANGEIQFNSTADFEIKILQNDTIVYSENHLGKETGVTGIVNLKIGEGENPSTNLSQLNWGKGQMTLKITLNGEEMNPSTLIAVPYALFSEKSRKIEGGNISTITKIVQNTNSLNSLSFIDLWGKHPTRGGELALAGNKVYLRYGVTEESFGTNGFILDSLGNVGIGTSTPSEKLHVVGTTKTKILEITGGGDIKEDFDSKEKLEPGDIVVIDERNPGKQRRTIEEYDKKVAGVISGANGINPGLSLSQENVLEGEFPLTMLGRIYVKVVGKVEVGDMLTTSTKAGFAMAVKDFAKAHGTVIGKAMTSNLGNEGLVLVLVNLQ